MLERLESPGWDLVPHAGQTSAAPAPAVARVPAAYQPQVLAACYRATVHSILDKDVNSQGTVCPEVGP